MKSQLVKTIIKWLDSYDCTTTVSDIDFYSIEKFADELIDIFCDECNTQSEYNERDGE